GYEAFVGLHPVPVRHGKTIGELATQFRDEAFPKCRLSILPMKNWERPMWFDQTGLPWVMPSPNMPTLETATVYPGMCLVEGTNLSEGRGTTRPFEIFGAPWIDPEAYAEALNGEKLPGVRFRPLHFLPTFHKHAGKDCGGVMIHVTDKRAFLPVRVGAACMLHAWRQGHTRGFAWRTEKYEFVDDVLAIDLLFGTDSVRKKIEAGESLGACLEGFDSDLANF